MKKISPWPLAIISFLAIVFAVNFLFLFFAIKTDDGLVDRDYYRKGLLYQTKADAEKKLGWEIGLAFQGPLGAGLPAYVKVSIVNGSGEAVKGANVVATLKRPATDRFDRPFELSADGGLYKGAVELPVSGFWDIEIKAARDGRSIERVFRVKA